MSSGEHAAVHPELAPFVEAREAAAGVDFDAWLAEVRRTPVEPTFEAPPCQPFSSRLGEPALIRTAIRRGAAMAMAEVRKVLKGCDLIDPAYEGDLSDDIEDGVRLALGLPDGEPIDPGESGESEAPTGEMAVVDLAEDDDPEKTWSGQ